MHDEVKYKVYACTVGTHWCNAIAVLVVCSVYVACHDQATLGYAGTSSCFNWVVSTGLASIGCISCEHDVYVVGF